MGLRFTVKGVGSKGFRAYGTGLRVLGLGSPSTKTDKGLERVVVHGKPLPECP